MTDWHDADEPATVPTRDGGSLALAALAFVCGLYLPLLWRLS